MVLNKTYYEIVEKFRIATKLNDEGIVKVIIDVRQTSHRAINVHFSITGPEETMTYAKSVLGIA